jgi:predicted nucleic acid-binding protein
VIVVDSSIALQWVLPEDGAEAVSLLGRPDLLAPDILHVEVTNVLAKKVRARDVTMDGAHAGLGIIREAIPTLVSSSELAEETLRLAVELVHPAYDCCFLACALKADATFATRDRPFIDRMILRGYGDRLYFQTGAS